MSTIAGERFDLRAIGSFNLLTLVAKNSSQDVFRVDARIEKAGASSDSHARLSRCATYITGLSFLGSWTSQNLTLSTSSNELQFFLDGVNISLPEVETHARMEMRSKSAKEFIFQVTGLEVAVSLGQHRKRTGSGHAGYFLFLNLKMSGVSNALSAGHLTSHGLLGGDDFEFATHPSAECETESTSRPRKEFQFSEVDTSDTSPSMISSCDIK